MNKTFCDICKKDTGINNWKWNMRKDKFELKHSAELCEECSNNILEFMTLKAQNNAAIEFDVGGKLR